MLTALDCAANPNLVPHADVLGAVFIALGAVFLLSPYVVRFRMKSDELDVEFREVLGVAAESTEDLEDAADAIGVLSDFSQDWLSQVNWLNRYLQLSSTTDDDAVRAVLRFCRERIADVSALIGEQDERTRFSVWWYSDEKDGLVFILSDDIRDDETKAFVFRRGQGIMGQAFVENRFWNLADAPASPGYVQIRKEPPDYHGLLCMPMHFGGHELVGMVCVDRALAQSFGESERDFVSALSDIIVTALTLPRIMQRFGVLPSHAIAALSEPRGQEALPETSPGGEGAT